MPAAKMELVVLSYNGEAPSAPISRSFDKDELTVGRSPTNDLVLDDPDRLISRFQARMRLTPTGEATLANISSNSIILVNEAEIPPGGSGTVRLSDRILVGRYLLGLREREAAVDFAQPADPFLAQPANAYSGTAPMAVIPEDFDVFAIPAKPVEASPLGEISLSDFEDPQGLARAVIDELPLSGAAELPAAPGEALYRERMLDVASPKVDPMAMFGGQGDVLDVLAPAESLALDHGLEVDSLFHTPAVLQEARAEAKPASLGEPDALFIDGISLGSEQPIATPPASAPAIPAAPVLPLAADSAPVDDPLAALMATAVEAPAIPAPFSEPAAQPAPPPPKAKSVASPPLSSVAEGKASAPPAASAPAASADLAALRAAFARGCGMPETSLPELTPAFMETVGKLFASMTAGTIRLIHARSATKHEMRANVTIIATAGNNPLKFAPDAQSAISQLLGHRFPGFMEPLRAIEDAFDDLSAHQVGLLAGARSAMYDVVGRFSPDRLQKRLGEETLLQTLVPAMRKAKLWELYENGFTEIAGEAREEFEALFENAFARAYEQEIERIYAGREE